MKGIGASTIMSILGIIILRDHSLRFKVDYLLFEVNSSCYPLNNRNLKVDSHTPCRLISSKPLYDKRLCLMYDFNTGD